VGRARVIQTASVAVVLTAAAGLAACGGDGGDQQAPSVADIPPGAVALVGDRPVTRREVTRRVSALRRAGGRAAGGSTSLVDQAMTAALRDAALEQEAAELGVEVAEANVRRRLSSARRQFRTRAAYRRFLGDQTESELVSQLRMQQLAEQVAKRSGEDRGSLASTLERWREMTTCRPAYAVPACDDAARS
jgi:hypothetical protein